MGESKSVQDFLDAFQGKSKEDASALIKLYCEDAEMLQEIIDILESNHASKLCDSICEALFHLNSLGQQEGMNLCLQLIPALIWAYYSMLFKHVNWSSSRVETLLLYIYNQIVQTNTESPFCNSFSIPTVSKPSIYHEPAMGMALALTESSLSQHEKADQPIMLTGPTKFLDRIPAGRRSLVIKSALEKYNSFLCSYLVPSLNCFCRTVIKLCSCGVPFTNLDNSDIPEGHLKPLHSYPKVNLSVDVIKEMVTALHFITFNGSADIAVTAMKCLHRKACYSVCAAAVLATNAAQDIIKLSTVDYQAFAHHSAPINPYKCSYRGVANLSLVQKRKLTNLALLTPRTPRPPGVSSLVGCISSTPSVDKPTAELEKKFDKIDSVLKRTLPLALGMGMKVVDNNDDTLNDETIELSDLQISTPTIIVGHLNLTDDEKNTDKTPLICNDQPLGSNNEKDDSFNAMHHDDSSLQTDAEMIPNDIPVTVVVNAYDTQL